MKLILVRHTSVDIPKGICYGQTDVPLKETFAEEAKHVKAQLEKECPKPVAVYTSPLSRCTKLAAFCGYPDAIKDARLLEMNFGEWEMQSYDSISDPNLELWYDDWFNVPATKGESLRNQFDRVFDFLNEIKNNEVGEALIFTHGGVITLAKHICKVVDFENMFSFQPHYGEITGLEF